jgi:hypothetical protein
LDQCANAAARDTGTSLFGQGEGVSRKTEASSQVSQDIDVSSAVPAESKIGPYNQLTHVIRTDEHTFNEFKGG